MLVLNGEEQPGAQTRAFFAYCRGRYTAMLRRREGSPPPWTEDPILQRYKFCCVHREDDRTTRWIREHVRNPLQDDPRVLISLLIARWFNRIETLERIEDLLLNPLPFRSSAYSRRLRGVRPIVTGAYMIRTPHSMDKLSGILKCVRESLPRSKALGLSMASSEWTLEQAHAELQELPYLGRFTAYELVCDLRFTALLENAPDICSWCALGPGAARGLGRVLGLGAGHFNYYSDREQEVMLGICRQLWRASHSSEYWPLEWSPWEMREVEHNLCEYDKYERARLGEGTPKQLFRPRRD